MQEVGTL